MGRSEDIIEQAFSEEERTELLKKNKYFNLGNDFDPVTILMDGKLPEFKSQGDKFRCVMAIAKFVKERNSLDGIADAVILLLENLEDDMAVLFMRQQPLSIIEAIVTSDKRTKHIIGIC